MLSGTATLVRDIGVVQDNSYPVFFVDAGDGTAYFKVLHSDLGGDEAIYRTDGTPAGTTLVANRVQANSGIGAGGTAYLGLAATSGAGMENLHLRTPAGGFTPVGVGSKVIFYASSQDTVDDGFYGNEPFITDGTSGSVHILKDIHPGNYQSSSPRGFTLVGGSVANGGIVYFSADDGTSGTELWKTDLTEAGTVRVKDIVQGAGGSSPSNLIDVDGTLYFTADDGVHGRELWRSDGTEAGTVMVAESLEGADAWPLANMTAVGGALYYTSASGTELWKADAGGASLVKSFISLGVVSAAAAVNGKLLLTLTLPDNAPAQLWRSDGTAAGTALLKQVPGVQGLTGAGTKAFFRATDSAGGDELWTTDGTSAGTARVADIYPGATGSQISAITRVGNDGVVYFSATDPTYGTEPWRSDGTAAGTYRIADLAAGAVLPAQFGPSNLISFRGSVFFNYTFGNPASAGLWRSDGTADGTERLFDGSVTRSKFTVFNGSLYWVEADNSSAPALVRSDGTAAGTSVVKRFTFTPPNGASIGELTVSGNYLYFTAAAPDLSTGTELWRTDGTPAGTVMFKDVAPGATSSNPQTLTDVNGRLFFFANTSAAGYEPWTSDGTPAGTVMLKDIFPGTTSSVVGTSAPTAAITTLDGMFFFVARSSNTMFGTQIWRSDGTPAGTVQATDFNDASLSLPSSSTTFRNNFLVPMGHSVYFQAGSVYSPGYVSLYKTDGTPATTTIVKQLGLPPNYPPFQMYNLNGTIYFFWMNEDGYDDYDLWKTDGTAVGTQIIGSIPLDVHEGKAVPDPLFMTSDGTIYFAGTVGTTTSPVTRLYRSNGQPGGMSVAEPTLSLIEAGYGYPAADLMLAAGDTFYFRANDRVTGAELWKLPPALPPPAAPKVTGLSAATAGTAKIVVTWDDVSSQETAYRLERSLDPSFATIDKSIHLLADTTSYTDAALIEDTTYYYRVFAYNSGGDSPASDVASAHTLATPRSPTGLTATAAGGVDSGRRVDLQWVDNATNENGFRIERSGTADFTVINKSVVIAADVTTYADTTVDPLTTYYYRVWAVNAVGDSRLATPAATVTTPDVLPTPSHGLVAWGVSNSRIELQWDAADTPFNGNWSIERADGDGRPFREIATAAPSLLRFSDTIVVPGVAYRYRVRAHSSGGGGFGDFSNQASASALPPQLTTVVKDINDTPSAANGTPSAVVVSGGIGYFAATGATGGRELYRTDGTSTGTFRVADLAPGSASSNPTALCDCNGTLYFYANGAAGSGLWRTDGTEAGTTFVKTIGASLTVPFVGVGDTLFFVATEAGGTSAGFELWKSDGTADGTVRVRDIRAGSATSSPANLTALGNDTLLFTANDGVHGTELWRSDGTEDGTYIVKDIAPAAPGGAAVTTSIVTVGSSSAYFAATTTAAGTELWRTDGTPAGTRMVKELAPATASADPLDLTAFAGQLYFTANDPAMGRSLFRTDGTADGTAVVKDFPEPVAPATPLKLRAAEGKLFLVTVSSAADGKTRLYASDGTTAGTKLASELALGLVGGGVSELVTVGGEAYALSPSINNGRQLWHSDGTPAGTFAILTVASATTPPASLTAYSGRLLFAATDTYGRELWTSGGTAGSTFRLADVNAHTSDAAPSLLTPVNDVVYFTAVDASGARGLYRTDGTDSGTWRIKTANVTAIAGLASAAGDPPAVLFTTWDAGVGHSLWRTDGNPGAGTQLTPASGASIPAVASLYAAGGLVFYQVQATNGTFPVWRSDGTAAGTSAVPGAENAINPTTSGGAPVAAGGFFYYIVRLAGGQGDELWRTDGSAAGTVRVRAASAAGESLRDLRAVGDRVYFVVRTATESGLWSTDGTPGGTAQVKSGFSNPSGGNGIIGLAAAGGAFYFAGYDAIHGNELWRSDGTADGTSLVLDANPGAASSSPSDVLDAGDGQHVYFVLTNDPRGRGLWRTDGTAGGTSRVKDLSIPGVRQPYYMLGVGGKTYFADGGYLWKTDGTTTGTVQQMPLGESPAAPAAAAGGRIIFGAVDPSYGHELFTLAVEAPAAPANAAAEPDASGTAHVTWEDGSGNESGFLVERLVVAPAGGGAQVERQLFLPANATALTDGGVRAGVSYRYRVSAYNASGVSGPAVTSDIVGTGGTTATPPSVESIAVGDGSAQRSQVMSLSVRFDRPVSLAAGAATLQRLNTGGSGANDDTAPTDASSALASPTSPDGGRTWVYTFVASSPFVQTATSGAATGSLADGVYTVAVDPAKVSAGGVVMTAASALTFHRLFGDVSGNKAVNLSDYGLFRSAFGRSAADAAYDPAFDFDNNGAVNTADYGQFRNRFGKAFAY